MLGVVQEQLGKRLFRGIAESLYIAQVLVRIGLSCAVCGGVNHFVVLGVKLRHSGRQRFVEGDRRYDSRRVFAATGVALDRFWRREVAPQDIWLVPTALTTIFVDWHSLPS